MDRLAVISDIHGNIPALDTVLADIRDRGIDRILCLGDVVGKGPQPEQAVDICREVCEVIVMGNHDEFMSSGREHPALPFTSWHRERLGRERLDYLQDLPPVHNLTLSGHRIRLYHASHIGPYHRVHAGAPEEDQRAMFGNTEFTGDGVKPYAVGYADIHQAFIKTFRGGGILFNTGSVGNPLDEPLASYAILEGNLDDDRPGPFSVQLIRMPYDIDLAVQIARDEGLPEEEFLAWEDELRTGRYRMDPASRAWRENSISG